MVGVDIDRDTPGQYHFDDFTWALPPENVDYRSRMWDIVARHQVDLIIPQCSRELLPLSTWEKPNTAVMISREHAIACASSKRWLCNATRADFMPRNITSGHWVAKPDRESGKRGYVEIPDGSVLVEYLPGAEYSVDCFQGTAVVRLREKVDKGVSAVTEVVMAPRLAEEALRLGRMAGITTCYGVQFKEDAVGRPRVIDLNPRVMGTMVCSLCAGVPLVWASVCATMGWDLPELPEPVYGTRYVRTRGGMALINGETVRV